MTVIRDIEALPVWVGHRNQLLVKVTAANGLHGWGEAGLSGRERAVMGAVEHYRELLRGRDAARIGALWQEMYRSQYFEGGRVLTAAISAIDIALHDLKGKALGVPVYDLLGGRQRDRVPLFASTTAPPGPAMLEEAAALVAAGFGAVRLSRGEGLREDGSVDPRRAVGETAPWMVRARDALGPAPVLGIDFHHRLSVAEAASFCQRLPSGTLDFIEEPIRDEDPDAYAALRRMTGIPFAVGEEFASKWQALPFLERGLTQFMRLDVCNIGGLTEAIKVAGWSEAHYVDLMPHNPLGPVCTAASIHLAAAVPNFAWLEHNPGAYHGGANSPEEHELFPLRPRAAGAFFPVPDGPGLGVEVNEDAVRRQSFRFWNPPMLRRPDGSLTNW